MQWTIKPFAILDGDYVLRFQDDDAVKNGERVLPVIADPDPPHGADEELWGPEYEVLPDRVRAYCKVTPMDRELLLEKKMARLEVMEARLTAVEVKSQRG